MQRYRSDVLVIGGGGAGLMAAYSASKHQVRVALVNKGKVQRTGVTIMAPGAVAAVDDRWKHEGDSKELHYNDTVLGGGYVNSSRMVEIMVQRSPELVVELENMGALFQREADGKRYSLRIDGGHSYPRCPYLEDRTGKEMVKAMAGILVKRNVDIYEDIMITRLIKENGRVIGAAGVRIYTLEPVLFECKAVILATGGSGSIYENTDNSADMTGDGYALALDAGAALRDMEFVQFYPIGLCYPPSLKGMLEGLCYYSHLLNAKGERFMEKYDPERLELSTRDRVSRAIMQEVKEGRGTPHGGVYMDLTYHEPGFIKKMTPAMYSTYRNIGLDPEKDLIEIAPTVHFFMGGLDVNENWESDVTGLYAAGEVCGGMHGGNRLSQNALAEVLVSGAVSGESAAEYAKMTDFTAIDPKEIMAETEKIDAIFEHSDGISPEKARADLKRIMWDKVGVTRNEGDLKAAWEDVNRLESTPVYVEDKSRFCNKSILEALELHGMLTTAKSVILSALERKESRAAHFRDDYPDTDDENYLVNFLLRKTDSGFEITSRQADRRRYNGEVQ
jgi:succinate dehydrogenase/fumarate reductase flavoprotein subunit